MDKPDIPFGALETQINGTPGKIVHRGSYMTGFVPDDWQGKDIVIYGAEQVPIRDIKITSDPVRFLGLNYEPVRKQENSLDNAFEQMI